ncbi:MAG: hypothetical protein AB7O97_14375 [Planctomycetota bacterium]
MLLLHVTSRVDGEPYPTLLRDKGFTGFPSLCFMDADGNVLAKQGERSVEGFERALERLEEVQELRGRLASEDDPKLRLRLLLAELELEMLRAAEIKERLEVMQLGAEDRARVDGYLVDAEVRDLRSRARELGNDQVAAEFLAIARAGRRPTAATQRLFWQIVLSAAAKAADAELAQTAFDALSELQLPATLQRRLQALLDQARAGKDRTADK